MRRAIDLAYPFHGQWLVQNSPASGIPSHGSDVFATTYAIDFVPVDDAGRSAPLGLRTLVGTEPPEVFTGFGRAVHSPVDGTILVARDGVPDHHAYRGFASVRYALTQRRRLVAGWHALAGNHVLIEREGVVIALCHLQRGSVRVRVGDTVRVGTPVAACGNSGNSTEPHLHLQAMDRADPATAEGVPITFAGALPHNGAIISS